jgi:hypothetical protein
MPLGKHTQIHQLHQSAVKTLLLDHIVELLVLQQIITYLIHVVPIVILAAIFMPSPIINQILDGSVVAEISSALERVIM